MNKIPVVFSFNDGYTMPAGVCITSLLINASENTFYDVFILYSSKRLNEGNRDKIFSLKKVYPNCNFTFIDLKEAFKDAYEIRKITIDAYYRLLIPELIKNYDKIIYLDIDIIICEDLSAFYELKTMRNFVLGRIDKIPSEKYLNDIGLLSQTYINSGVMLINSKLIRENVDMNFEVNKYLRLNLLYQDQDIINIIFKGKIGFIDEKYNYTYLQNKNKISSENVIFHYTGSKPWNNIVAFGDIWWEYYRKSIFYDKKYYSNYIGYQFFNLNNTILIGNFFKKLRLSKILLKFIESVKR